MGQVARGTVVPLAGEVKSARGMEMRGVVPCGEVAGDAVCGTKVHGVLLIW